MENLVVRLFFGFLEDRLAELVLWLGAGETARAVHIACQHGELAQIDRQTQEQEENDQGEEASVFFTHGRRYAAADATQGPARMGPSKEPKWAF
jgi:hypothetical protein